MAVSDLCLKFADASFQLSKLYLHNELMSLSTAFIPYPVIYGTVTDSACLVWEQTCGQKGNCWLYSSDKFRHSLHGLTLFLLCMAVVFDVIVVLLSDRIKNLYDDQLVCDCDHDNDQMIIRPNTDY